MVLNGAHFLRLPHRAKGRVICVNFGVWQSRHDAEIKMQIICAGRGVMCVNFGMK